jgi:hypothetical protein
MNVMTAIAVQRTSAIRTSRKDVLLPSSAVTAMMETHVQLYQLATMEHVFQGIGFIQPLNVPRVTVETMSVIPAKAVFPVHTIAVSVVVMATATMSSVKTVSFVRKIAIAALHAETASAKAARAKTATPVPQIVVHVERKRFAYRTFPSPVARRKSRLSLLKCPLIARRQA